MAHKITVKISKNNYIHTTKNLQKKSKEVRAYARALVYVPDTINVIFSKFACTIISIEFLQCTFKSTKRLGLFYVIRNQLPNLWPKPSKRF